MIILRMTSEVACGGGLIKSPVFHNQRISLRKMKRKQLFSMRLMGRCVLVPGQTAASHSHRLTKEETRLEVSQNTPSVGSYWYHLSEFRTSQHSFLFPEIWIDDISLLEIIFKAYPIYYQWCVCAPLLTRKF